LILQTALLDYDLPDGWLWTKITATALYLSTYLIISQ